MTTDSPIFIVGMNGSGTGALTRALAQHETIYAFPGESRVFITFMRRFPRPIENLDSSGFAKLLTEVSNYGGLTRWNGGQQLALGNMADSATAATAGRPVAQTLAAALDAGFRFFAQREDKRRWCEKTPFNAYYIESLVAHFPDAKIIHIIRDGRDAALSFERRFGFNPLLSVYRWKRLIREARLQGERVGAAHYLEVRYEDLTSSPRDVLETVCEFTGLNFQEAMLAPNRPTQTPMLAPTFVANSEKWRTMTTAAQLGHMERVSGGLLHELGYPVVNSPGDEQLPGWKIGVMRLGDYLTTSRRYLKRVWSGGGSIAGKLKTLVNIAISSVKSRAGWH